MEHFADDYGCVSVAWVGDSVLYARFERKISAQVGERYAARLLALVGEVESLRYFADSRNLTEYDILARSAIVRAVLSNRLKFASTVVLTWAGGAGPVSRTFASALDGSIEYLTDAAQFESRMLAVAPRANQAIEAAPKVAARSRRSR